MSLSIPFPFGWLLNKKAARVEVNISLAFLHWVGIALHPWPFVSDIAIFVLKGDVKLQPSLTVPKSSHTCSKQIAILIPFKFPKNCNFSLDLNNRHITSYNTSRLLSINTTWLMAASHLCGWSLIYTTTHTYTYTRASLVVVIRLTLLALCLWTSALITAKFWQR